MGNPLFGDELSTLWIVGNNGFFDSVKPGFEQCRDHPPLYFMLSWLTTQLGSAGTGRIPALVAGTLTIPMSALLGYRTVSHHRPARRFDRRDQPVHDLLLCQRPGPTR